MRTFKKEGVITNSERKEAIRRARLLHANDEGKVKVLVCRQPLTIIMLRPDDPLFDEKVNRVRGLVLKPHLYMKKYNYEPYLMI